MALNRYGIGDREPARVATPNDDAELASTLRECGARGEAAIVFGGGTLQRMGSIPERYDVAVSTRGLRGLVAYEPRDLTVSVRAGTSLAELARALAEHDQFVPLDAPLPERGTVGGALAAGWIGPRRRAYGRPRDFVIGSTVALCDGTVAKAGGMVVKNVSGYDMSKLYVGSFGTLAALTVVNFKTLPRPRVQCCARAPLPERTRARATAGVAALEREPTLALAVRGFPEIGGSDGLEGRLVLLFEGSQAVVERAIRDLRSTLGASGVPSTAITDDETVVQRVADAYVASLGERSTTYRLAGMPADAPDREAAICALAKEAAVACETVCDVLTGDVVARISAPTVDRFFERARPFDDALHDRFSRATILSRPNRLAADLQAWGEVPQAIDLMRAIKAQFDPAGTLAPGRFVGGL